MKTPTASRRQELVPVLLLLVVSAVLFCVLYNRCSPAHWAVPIEYGTDPETSDAKAVLSHIKAAKDGDFVPFLWKNIRHLNAPFVANWNDMPIIEEFLFWGAGLVARVTGIFTAANIALMVGYMLAALGFYAAARATKVSAILAFAGALIFAFTRFPFARQIHHLQVAYYWYVPLCLVVTWWVANRELKIGDARFWIAVAIGVITGVQNPYYTGMFAQLLCLSAAVAWVRKDRPVVLAAGAVLVATFLGFMAMNIDTFTYKLVHGANPGAMTRKYQWLEFYAMKPLDLLVPPPDHRFFPFASFGGDYFKNVLIPGEVPPGCYIGLLGMAALAVVIVVAVRRSVVRPVEPVPTEAWQVLWIGLFSIVGGVNGLIGVFGIQLFRSANRYCIFILAIALLYAARRLSALKLDIPTKVVIAAAAIGLAIWDQTPPAPADDAIEKTAKTVESDRKFVADLESRLPQNAMIFQIPVMEFPESPIPGLSAYEHFRPYFFSEKLRFSFGTMKGRPEDQWQKNVLSRDVGSLVRDLEAYGFSAVYVNTTPFQDKGGNVKKQFASVGKSEVITSPDHELFCILLNPSPNPVLPGGVSRVSP